MSALCHLQTSAARSEIRARVQKITAKGLRARRSLWPPMRGTTRRHQDWLDHRESGRQSAALLLRMKRAVKINYGR